MSFQVVLPAFSGRYGRPVRMTAGKALSIRRRQGATAAEHTGPRRYSGSIALWH
ncbi:hypothetical protein [Fimbriiglobus ruber]|uniref:Uncharacterized protein n=1 Tax=Fimbriiglobus ruber TaxID=1908690 RepID=A0A225DB85_9BACT|nr:hypothetical protein [Fimbriiglobus ruber]OWK34566.1 hypothetical protein FRUB_10537 [Fimbriiglobus ruber]